MSHSTVPKVQHHIGGRFNGELIDAVMRFRIVGDNVNFKVGVSREKKDKMGHMDHWFRSTAIIQHTQFSYAKSSETTFADATKHISF